VQDKFTTPAIKVPFVCPRCKGTLAVGAADAKTNTRYYSEYRTSVSGPIDTSVWKKSEILFEFGEHARFEELVRYYYSITFDRPDNIARRYQASILAGTERVKSIIQELTRGDSDFLVDIGCGTGGLLLAAQGRFSCIYGVDIALRWPVIAQKRLSENNATATLVCADAA
jgi:hypothetical protein